MPELPRLTGPETITAFEKAGFFLARIRGSHHILKKEGVRFVLTVPVHGREPLKPGTLRSLIRDVGMTLEEFVELLN